MKLTYNEIARFIIFTTFFVLLKCLFLGFTAENIHDGIVTGFFAGILNKILELLIKIYEKGTK